jgi:hypothetical protein
MKVKIKDATNVTTRGKTIIAAFENIKRFLISILILHLYKSLLSKR